MEMKTEWDFSNSIYSGITDENYQKMLDSDDLLIDAVRDKYINCNFKKMKASQFKEYLGDVASNKIMSNYSKVYTYYSYLNSLDTQNQDINKILSTISNRYVICSDKLSFLDDKIKELGYDKLIKFSEMSKFKNIKNGLIGIANSIKYILDSKEESMLSLLGNIKSHTTDDLYSELTNSYTFSINGDTVTESKLMNMTKSTNENERKIAFDMLFAKYKGDAIVYSAIYKSVAKTNATLSKKRGYASVISSRNISEDLSDDTVDILVSTVKSKIYPLYHQFLKLKATLLNKPTLEYYDIYAKIDIGQDTEDVKFEDGVNIYLDIIKKFDKGMYEYSLDMFNSGRVSVFPNIGKRGGAYCSYAKNRESYVLLNYNNSYDDVMTLAHELGHAIHGNMMQKNEDMVYDAPLCLAETASIFNETLLHNEIFRKTKDNKTKIIMLMDELDGVFSTIVRQIMYTSFEYKCHNSFYNDNELSLDDFNNIWYDELKAMYADNVNISEDMKIGWARIPHLFYTPFYCYTYSFGNILSLNLLKMYNSGMSKSKFKSIYRDILSSGSSVKPEELLLKSGIDVKSDAFFDGAISYITDMLDEVNIQIDFEI